MQELGGGGGRGAGGDRSSTHRSSPPSEAKEENKLDSKVCLPYAENRRFQADVPIRKP